eukprot:725392-Hanusia_phi.AAC.2
MAPHIPCALCLCSRPLLLLSRLALALALARAAQSQARVLSRRLRRHAPPAAANPRVELGNLLSQGLGVGL